MREPEAQGQGGVEQQQRARQARAAGALNVLQEQKAAVNAGKRSASLATSGAYKTPEARYHEQKEQLRALKSQGVAMPYDPAKIAMIREAQNPGGGLPEAGNRLAKERSEKFRTFAHSGVPRTTSSRASGCGPTRARAARVARRHRQDQEPARLELRRADVGARGRAGAVAALGRGARACWPARARARALPRALSFKCAVVYNTLLEMAAVSASRGTEAHSGRRRSMTSGPAVARQNAQRHREHRRRAGEQRAASNDGGPWPVPRNQRAGMKGTAIGISNALQERHSWRG